MRARRQAHEEHSPSSADGLSAVFGSLAKTLAAVQAGSLAIEPSSHTLDPLTSIIAFQLLPALLSPGSSSLNFSSRFERLCVSPSLPSATGVLESLPPVLTEFLSSFSFFSLRMGDLSPKDSAAVEVKISFAPSEVFAPTNESAVV